MKIIRTAEEAKKIRETEKKAHAQTMQCPECNVQFYELPPGDYSGLFSGLMIAVEKRVAWDGKISGHIYRCECKACGCIWETDFFGA